MRFCETLANLLGAYVVSCTGLFNFASYRCERAALIEMSTKILFFLKVCDEDETLKHIVKYAEGFTSVRTPREVLLNPGNIRLGVF